MRLSYFAFYLSLVVASASLGLPVDTAHAAPQEYQQAREEYLRLVKVDPGVERVRLWDRTANRLTSFLNASEDKDYSARAAYLLGRLYEHRYRQLKTAEALNRSIYFYQRIFEDNSEHKLADDALLYSADLELEGNKNPEAAERSYWNIVKSYSSGDMFKKACKRLEISPAEAREKLLSDGVTSDAELAKIEPIVKKSETKTKQEKPKPIEQLKTSPMVTLAPRDAKYFSVLPIVAKFPKKVVVVIDPGHGGEEEGAHGVQGTFEKDIVLNISLLLDELLRKRLKASTVLTRVRDVHVELAERTQAANSNNADLFISVHANASRSKRANGIETYYLDNTNDKSSLRLAKMENAYSNNDLDDLGFMLSDLIQNAKLDDSVSLAHYIQNAMYEGVTKHYPDVNNLGVKKAPFYVLMGAHMPCVLAEVSFIDNKIEGSRLITREYQRLVAESLFEGIVAYLKNHWKLR